MGRHWVLNALMVAAVASAPAAAQTSYPMITHASPVAVQRGQTASVTVSGQMNFFGAYKVLVEGKGVEAEIVPGPANAKLDPKTPVRNVALTVKVDKDAALGVREFRIATSLGISSLGQLVIVDDPVVAEKGDNDTPTKANAIPLPSVVTGGIEKLEDVDYFKFRGEEGQIVTVEVHCARIQDKIHDLQKHADPLIALYDADGRELAANDDWNFADPLLTYKLPKTGDYLVQIRDSKYDFDARWVYAMEVTHRPRVTHLYPMAGNPGRALEVEPVGSAKTKQAKVSFTPPADLGLGSVQIEMDGAKLNPSAFIVSSLPQALESEPNDTADQANRVTVPCGINGRIGVKRDHDHFRFTGVKGKAIRFEVKARRFGTILRSSLDSVLDVLGEKGDVLATNDDAAGKDAALVFTPAADGDFLLRIRDLNSKGGDTFVYHIEADWALPDFTIKCDPDKAMIGPGSSTAWFVQIVRTNGFTGPVQVEMKGLPAGVTVSPLTIPESMTQGVLVLTAAADAQRDAANVQIVGTAKAKMPDGKEETLTRLGTPIQEIYSPGGGRARFDVKLHTVAVTDPSDILKVEVTPKTISLKPGEEVKLEVEIQRRQDYDKTVSLDVMLRHLGGVFGNPLPTGVTLVEGKSKTLLGTGSKGHIVLKAAANAPPVDNVPIAVMCHVSVNFVVKVSYSSEPILVTIRK